MKCRKVTDHPSQRTIIDQRVSRCANLVRKDREFEAGLYREASFCAGEDTSRVSYCFEKLQGSSATIRVRDEDGPRIGKTEQPFLARSCINMPLFSWTVFIPASHSVLISQHYFAGLEVLPVSRPYNIKTISLSRP